ncbi:uncharacterized protein IUM83_01309 [Phytophthora cinnamomi]|uniref:uncharacterized protein n=1 Tax=Phytophthora cinnamomi TaxID=4785 RepID=UPI0035599573|nr:hypothetical protein IUM83_01309 [Phytophthora cinnamomi]
MERAPRGDGLCSPLLDEDTMFSVMNDVLDESNNLSAGFELLNEDERAEKPKKKRRRDRNRPCHEIARLQAEAVELEQELQNQLNRATETARSSFGAMVQNAELKSLLRQSLEDTRTLELNLSKQVDELVQMLPPSMNTMARNLAFDATHDDDLFKRMANDVDEQYRNMGRILHLAGLHGGDSEVTDAYICQSRGTVNGQVGHLLKSRTRILSPFTSQALVNALWTSVESDERATLRTKQATNKLDLPLGLASRIAVQKYEVVVGDYVCTMRTVMKQFIEKDRVAQVWSSVGDWPHMETMRIANTHEQGWGFIRPVNDNTSLCVNYVMMNPTVERLAPDESCDAQLRSLAKLYQDFIISRLHTLENQTLDRIMQERKNATACSVER